MATKKYDEVKLQMACVRWFDFEYPNERECLFMVNNENRSAREAARNKKMGLRRGVSDMIYQSPTGETIYIELKTPTGGLSKWQKIFRDKVTAHGSTYVVIRDVQEFITLIRKHNKR